MKSRLILSTSIAIVSFASRIVAGDEKYPPINPALTYWQAAALMPDFKGPKSTALGELMGGKKPFDVAKAKELLSGTEQSLGLFAKAAMSVAPCDWGLSLEDGPATLMPHTAKIMELSRVAIVRADALFAEGRTSEGIDWLLIAHRAARHAGAGDILISELVQMSLETSVMNAAALRCLGWDDAMRKKYADGLKALPPLHSLRDTFRGESTFIDWTERTLTSGDPRKAGELSAMLANPGKSDAALDTEKEKQLVESMRKEFAGESGKKLFAQWRDLYRRTEEALGKPWKEGHAELEALAKEAEQSYILIKVSYPVFPPINARQFEIATRRTMLEAALAYGPKLDEAAAATYKDAFEGEPLQLVRGGDGTMTLKAARQYAKPGKDIELKLGR